MSTRQITRKVTHKLAEHHRQAKAVRSYERALAAAPTPRSREELMALLGR